MNSAGSFVAPDARRDHLATLQLVHSHIQRLQPYLANYDQECKWLEQLKGDIDVLNDDANRL